METYLNRPDEVILYAYSVCGLFSSFLLELKKPLEQLFVFIPSSDYGRHKAECYLKLYDRETNALSYNADMRKIKKMLLAAKDETAVLDICDPPVDDKRLGVFFNQLNVMQDESGYRQHNTALISRKYLTTSVVAFQKRICMELSEDFDNCFDYSGKEEISSGLNIITRWMISFICQDYTKFMHVLENTMNDVSAECDNKEFKNPESQNSFIVIGTVIKLLRSYFDLKICNQKATDLLYEVIDSQKEQDTDLIIVNEFLDVLNRLIENDSIEIIVNLKAVEYSAEKPLMIVKDDKLYLNENTIKMLILPEMSKADSLKAVIDALIKKEYLYCTKKNRSTITVNQGGVMSIVSCYAMCLDGVLTPDNLDKINAKLTEEWFTGEQMEPRYLPLVCNKANDMTYRKFDYDLDENLHCLITGMSGKGKTVFLTEQLVSLQRAGMKVVVLDTGRSFTRKAVIRNLSVNGSEDERAAVEKYVEEHITFHNIEENGIPVDILNLGNTTGMYNKAERNVIFSILAASISNMGKRQIADLHTSIEKSEPHLMSMKENILSNSTPSLAAQFESILAPFDDYDVMKQSWGEFLSSTKDIVVISTDSIPGQGGCALVDMLLMSLYHYHHRNNDREAQRHLSIVIDEVQNQNLSLEGTIVKILNEGRKDHMNLIYATQSLAGFNKDKTQKMSSADTHVYFCPDEQTARSVSKTLHISVDALTGLSIGECFIKGTVYNHTRERNMQHILFGYTPRHFVKTDNK